MVAGDAEEVLRVTAVEARAVRAWEPSGVRLAFSWERRWESSGRRATYRCERLCSCLQSDFEGSYLV